ncbi:MAG: hypothetical protein HYV09_21945 [Deltaproteobacteria bacterium]|nr:hypothetical protein [Deltaproteobacteria bacterium]
MLDATGSALTPEQVMERVHAHARWGFRESPAGFGRRGSPIAVLPDGRWAIAADAGPALASMRRFARERVELARRHARPGPDPAVRAEYERRLAARAAELTRLTRALLVAFPSDSPEMVVLVDVAARALSTFRRAEFARLRARVASYDVIGALGVRPLLRVLQVDPGERRLAELSPPQKSFRLNRSGRTLQVTPSMLVQGSCGISQPFGGEAKLAGYLAAGDFGKLQTARVGRQIALRALPIRATARRRASSLGLLGRDVPGALGAA